MNVGRITFSPTAMVTCKACNGTGRSPYRDNACCDRCDGWGKYIAPITKSGYEIERRQ